MYDPNCSLCPLGDYVRSRREHVCVPSDESKAGGGESIDVLVVGMNPGKTESKGNIPFIGDSKGIRNYLDEQGWSYVITNAVKCLTPPLSASPGSREPQTTEIHACAKYLKAELAHYRPRVVLALGNVALWALTGHKGINKARGRPHDLKGELRRVLAEPPEVLGTIHPAGANRYPSEWGKIRDDVRGVTDYLSGVKPPSCAYTRAKKTLALPPNPLLTYDLETSTANYMSKTYSFYCAGVLGMGDETVKSDLTGNLITKAVLDPRNTVITFNGLSFDEAALCWTTGYTGPLPVHYDVMQIASLVDETMRHVNLENCAVRWAGVAPWKDENRTRFNKKLGYAPRPHGKSEWENLLEYNARDVAITRHLFNVLWPRLTKQQQRLYHHLIMPAGRVLRKMYENGLPVNRNNITKALIRCFNEEEKALEPIREAAYKFGLVPFNMNSPQQVGALLYKHLGLPILKRTPGEGPSTDQETLKRLIQYGRHLPVLEGSLTYRQYSKLRMGTLERLLDLVTEDDRVHFQYFQNRTDTGRTSGPAQQMPRPDWIRRCIAAPEGYKLISCDQSQIELRLMAWRSREPTMLRVFKEGYLGGDIHNATALRIVNLQRQERGEESLQAFDKVLYKQERDLAKPVNFGTQYGAEWYTLQTQLFVDYGIRVSRKTTEWLRDEVFFGTFSRLPAYFDERVRETMERGLVESPFGRLRHLENINSSDRKVRGEAARQAINTDNQGDGSDITLVGLILSLAKAPWLEPVHFGHDCNVFLAPDERVDEAISIIKPAMEGDTLDYIADHFGFTIDVPLVADCKVLQEWE